jgi:DNA (cytosine-5)-methyltransferase 1
MSGEAKKKWIWWNIPTPAIRNSVFADLVEEKPKGVAWHTPAETKYLLGLMSKLNRDKVADAQKSGHRMVGTIYRRTRPDKSGSKRQRAEVRFDNVSGCLRTPAGGSSRQTLLVVEGRKIRSRLLSPREAARLMGLDDDYVLPPRYNDAYHVCGDGVCVPVVRHIARGVLLPVLAASAEKELVAAE